MSDEQTFIEAKQHPQAGPETTHNMCEKFENFLKNRFFDFFLTFFVGGPLTDFVYFGWFWSCFSRFCQRLRKWRANLYRGETTSPSRSWNNPYHVRKVWELFKKSIFWFFLDQFLWGAPPHKRITVKFMFFEVFKLAKKNHVVWGFWGLQKNEMHVFWCF